MNYKDFTAEIKRRIPKLSYSRQLELSIIICKKLLPEYQIFSQAYEWGEPKLLSDAIKKCEQALTVKPNIPELKTMLPKIDKIVPHMDDFGDYMGSYALNASASVYETLQFIIDKDATHIFNISTYYTDTIDFKIQEDEDLTEDEIDNHPLMVEARNFLLGEID